MPDSPIHLVVGTPCYGGMVNHMYAASLLKLSHACRQAGNVDLSVLMPGGDALITRARQDVVAHFLDQESATHLLFIDADISFPPEQVFRLLAFDADVTAAAYPTKRIHWGKVREAVKAGQEPLEQAALSYVLEFADPTRIEARNGFAKTRFAGTGFLLIKRQALLKMVERYPELKYQKEHQAEDPLSKSPWRYAFFNCMIDETGTYLSEDFSFCRRWTDMGGEIWTDLQSKLTHIGPISFAGDVSTQFNLPKP